MILECCTCWIRMKSVHGEIPKPNPATVFVRTVRTGTKLVELLPVCADCLDDVFSLHSENERESIEQGMAEWLVQETMKE
jgi:hypothetical protein